MVKSGVECGKGPLRMSGGIEESGLSLGVVPRRPLK